MGNRMTADWGGGMSACCKPPVELFAVTGNGWLHSALCIISSCQSAATFKIVKALLVTSLTHVNSATADTGSLVRPQKNS